MRFHLYRPITWRRGGVCVRVDAGTLFSTHEMALLVQLKLATLLPTITPNFGDFMSDDRSSALRLVTPPASEPLTLAQAKTFLRIEHSADDEPITRAIAAARVAAEQYVKCALLPQTWEMHVANPSCAELRLPVGPARSITSITLTTEAGATSTMSASNYRLSVDGFAVLFTNAPSIEKMTVQFVAGIATALPEIPQPIIQGMLHHIAVMLENRDGDVPMPVQAMACYQPYRRISL
jgi:uncharacterized phiE125 gp8 family phage protein